jgi:putative addiction module component (TIGR02574 family)
MAATIDISKLSVEERLQLLGELWDSLSATMDAMPISDELAAELDRRMDEMDQDGSLGIPWDDVVREIRGRKR